MDLGQIFAAIVGIILSFTASVGEQMADSAPQAQPQAALGNGTLANCVSTSNVQTCPAISQKPDIKKEAGLYLMIYNPKESCVKYGGIWREDSDFVGCQNLLVYDCSQYLLSAAKEKCVNAGAEWSCGSAEGVYCKN